MKTRNGFVSNSSSSSFIILIKPEQYKAALELMTAAEKKAIKSKFQDSIQKTVNCFGIEVYDLTYSDYSCESWSGYIPEKYHDSIDEFVDNIHEKLGTAGAYINNISN